MGFLDDELEDAETCLAPVVPLALSSPLLLEEEPRLLVSGTHLVLEEEGSSKQSPLLELEDEVGEGELLLSIL